MRPLALLRADPGIGEFLRRNELAFPPSKSIIFSSSSPKCARKPSSAERNFTFGLSL